MRRTRIARDRRLSGKPASPTPVAEPVVRPALEVINGIKLTVNGRELAVRLGERIRWHRERGDILIEQMKKLAELESSAAEDLANILGRYESPRAIMEKRLREHQDRAVFLAFIRDHIAPDAVFRLDSTDLRMIDFVPS